jgi:hypothetical protein
MFAVLIWELPGLKANAMPLSESVPLVCEGTKEKFVLRE